MALALSRCHRRREISPLRQCNVGWGRSEVACSSEESADRSGVKGPLSKGKWCGNGGHSFPSSAPSLDLSVLSCVTNEGGAGLK